MMRLNDESMTELHRRAIASLEQAESTLLWDLQVAYASRSVALSNLVLIELMMRNGVVK